MASEPAASIDAAAPAAAPLAGTRAQAMQRLQVGVFGLAAMVLLVGLANIFITSARHNDARTAAQGAAASSAGGVSANDPLADAGVVPDMAAGAASAPASDTAASPAR